MSFTSGPSNPEAAAHISRFDNKASPTMAATILQNNFLQTSAALLSNHTTNQFARGTVDSKVRANTLFSYFLKAVGLPDFLSREPISPQWA